MRARVNLSLHDIAKKKYANPRGKRHSAAIRSDMAERQLADSIQQLVSQLYETASTPIKSAPHSRADVFLFKRAKPSPMSRPSFQRLPRITCLSCGFIGSCKLSSTSPPASHRPDLLCVITEKDRHQKLVALHLAHMAA